MTHIKDTDFKALTRNQTSLQMKMRLLALAHFQDGHSPPKKIAQFLKVSRTSVNKSVSIYLSEGLEGLKEKSRTGRPAFLSVKQKIQLTESIEEKVDKQDKEAQQHFKKFQIKMPLKIPKHIALESVNMWLQDEARFGQQNTTTRLWVETGSRPRAVKQQQFE